MPYKTYKVVKIIDDKQIVINAGADCEVKRGDEIEIYKPGIEVYDDDTKESLGTLDYIKARVEAVVVLPKMTICKRFTTVASTPALTTFGNIAHSLSPVVIADSLDVDPEDITGGYEDIDRKIKVGDLVRISAK